MGLRSFCHSASVRAAGSVAFMDLLSRATRALARVRPLSSCGSMDEAGAQSAVTAPDPRLPKRRRGRWDREHSCPYCRGPPAPVHTCAWTRAVRFPRADLSHEAVARSPVPITHRWRAQRLRPSSRPPSWELLSWRRPSWRRPSSQEPSWREPSRPWRGSRRLPHRLRRCRRSRFS